MTKTLKTRTTHYTVGACFAVSFADSRVEFWQHNPSILTKRQIKHLGITGIKEVKVAVKSGEGLGK